MARNDVIPDNALAGWVDQNGAWLGTGFWLFTEDEVEKATRKLKKGSEEDRNGFAICWIVEDDDHANPIVRWV